MAAAREGLERSVGLVAQDEIEGAQFSAVHFEPGRFADLLDSDAARRGVTLVPASSVPYDLTRRWAKAFDAAGFAGMRNQSRFSTNRVEAVARFGDAGKPTQQKPVTSSRPVADVLREHDYMIIESPSLTTLSPLIN